MRSAPWSWFFLGACLLVARVDAQMFRVEDATGEIYSLSAIQCVAPVEAHRTSPPLFTTFADSAIVSFYDCNPDAAVTTSIKEDATIRSDSIYVHQYAYASLDGESAQAALARSDTWIRFTIDPGHRLAYQIWGGLETENPGCGTAIARYSLTRVGGPVINSRTAQSGPCPPGVHPRGIDFQGVLDPGDYVYEVHTSASADYLIPPQGVARGELYLHLSFRDLTTAIQPSTWGLVKALYQ